MITCKIEGLDKLRSDFSKGTDIVQEEVKEAMRVSVGQVQRTAQEMSPYDTGTLRRSITPRIENSGFTGIVFQDLNQANYGPYQEYGTRFMRAQPFMGPAFEVNYDFIIENFRKAMDSIISRIVT